MLKAKPLAIDTFRENVVVLSRESLELRPERLTGSRKVEVRAAGRQLFATLMIADRDDVVAPDEGRHPSQDCGRNPERLTRNEVG